MSDSQPQYRAAFFIALLICLILGGANLIMGDLNQDEGWYLYAAQSVADGKLPYRDFAFTQGPMLPLIYSLASPIVDSFGVGGGRAVTLLFGLAAALLAAGTARRLGGAAAGVISFTLIAVNVYQSYFTTVVKTYSLCAFFMIAGFYAMSRFIGSRKTVWLVIAGIGLAAAAGTRLSSGILLLITGVWMLVQQSRWGKLGWLWFGLGGGVTLMFMFVPLYLAAPEGFLFGLLEYHTLRESGGLASSLVLKAGFVSRLVQFYFVAAAMLVLLAAAKVFRPFKGHKCGCRETDSFALIRLMWVSVFAVTLVHILAPFPYDDYQTPVFPVLAVALAVSWTGALKSWIPEASNTKPMNWLVWSILLISTASAFASPINMDWMISERDRIWWVMKDKPALLQLREVGREVREMCEGDLLLTQDTYLAVEAGKKVPAGWEMGPFSYYPEMTNERAEQLHLLNKQRLMSDLMTLPAEVAAISGYGLSIASPQVVMIEDDERQLIEEALLNRYELSREVPTFGQAATLLKIYELKDSQWETP